MKFKDIPINDWFMFEGLCYQKKSDTFAVDMYVEDKDCKVWFDSDELVEKE